LGVGSAFRRENGPQKYVLSIDIVFQLEMQRLGNGGLR
jgi:hypothetical protein